MDPGMESNQWLEISSSGAAGAVLLQYIYIWWLFSF